MHKHSNRTQLPGALVRDAFRGLRFGARQFGQALSSANIPEPLGTAASGLIRKADRLSSEVELMSRQSIGGSFKPNGLPDSGHFDEMGLMIGKLSVSECANLAKQGLVSALHAFGETNPFISEYLCNTCIKQLLHTEKDSGAGQKCVALFELLIEKKVCGMPPGLSSVAGVTERESVSAAYFATVLWLFVPRTEAASEDELLSHCCKVAGAKRTEIFAFRNNKGATKELFEYYLNII
ncbi:MAG: hypothetical protein ABJO09_17160 [Hyphomicrobiales bacterium]